MPWVDAQDPRVDAQDRRVIQESQKPDTEPPAGGVLFFFDLNATVSWFFCLGIRKFLTYFLF